MSSAIRATQENLNASSLESEVAVHEPKNGDDVKKTALENHATTVDNNDSCRNAVDIKEDDENKFDLPGWTSEPYFECMLCHLKVIEFESLTNHFRVKHGNAQPKYREHVLRRPPPTDTGRTHRFDRLTVGSPNDVPTMNLATVERNIKDYLIDIDSDSMASRHMVGMIKYYLKATLKGNAHYDSASLVDTPEKWMAVASVTPLRLKHYQSHSIDVFFLPGSRRILVRPKVDDLRLSTTLW